MTERQCMARDRRSERRPCRACDGKGYHVGVVFMGHEEHIHCDDCRGKGVRLSEARRLKLASGSKG